MKTHKTFAGMARATERLIGELSGAKIEDDREYRAYNVRVGALLSEHNALWSNPADVAEAKSLANRLRDAWHNATI